MFTKLEQRSCIKIDMARGRSAQECCVKHHHLRPSLRRKRRHLVVQNPIILHDNARSDTTAAVKDLLRRCQWKILEHPPSPTTSPLTHSSRDTDVRGQRTQSVSLDQESSSQCTMVQGQFARCSVLSLRVLQLSRAVASWSKASCLGFALWNARWFESSWEKTFSHEISANAWDRCPPSIVMHLGATIVAKIRFRKPAITAGRIIVLTTQYLHSGWFGRPPPRKATLLVWKKRASIAGSIKDRNKLAARRYQTNDELKDAVTAADITSQQLRKMSPEDVPIRLGTIANVPHFCKDYHSITHLLTSSLAFKEPGGSLPPSHKPANGPYPEQD
ncbi:hypothetical protein ANN_02674 [Periplaneta americana]|uniref:Uncharacterized protein n=1 Tax=Periplaneta americana TaxID=6978 RepID=A0ABQ8TWY3_PERAM|nr:hypothetical protein ANN_02674 [Periplaneta americana]